MHWCEANFKIFGSAGFEGIEVKGRLRLNFEVKAETYLQLSLWQWGAGHIYILVKGKHYQNPNAVMGLYVDTFQQSLLLGKKLNDDPRLNPTNQRVF